MFRSSPMIHDGQGTRSPPHICSSFSRGFHRSILGLCAVPYAILAPNMHKTHSPAAKHGVGSARTNGVWAFLHYSSILAIPAQTDCAASGRFVSPSAARACALSPQGAAVTTPTANASLIWAIAELLRGDYKQSDYGKIVLPFTLPAVLAEHVKRKASGLDLAVFPSRAAGHSFYNISRYAFPTLLGDANNLWANALHRRCGQRRERDPHMDRGTSTPTRRRVRRWRLMPTSSVRMRVMMQVQTLKRSEVPQWQK